MAAQFYKQERSATSIAFVHHKGGTGKTTTCINVAGWLAKMGRKVLVVDMDPQGNATAGLGVDRASLDDSLYDVFFNKTALGDVILETECGVYLAPSSLDLLAAETHLGDQVNCTNILWKHLKNIEGYFDYVLIDVPPGSTLLMINGIVASENIIIPLDSGVFAYETMETLKTLVVDLNEALGVEANVMMLLLREYPCGGFFRNPTKRIMRMLEHFLDENNIPDVEVIKIPFSKKIFEAQMRGQPISFFAPYSSIGRAYKKVAREIMNGDH